MNGLHPTSRGSGRPPDDPRGPPHYEMTLNPDTPGGQALSGTGKRYFLEVMAETCGDDFEWANSG